MTAPDLDLTALHNKCAVLFLLHVLLDHTDTPLCTYLHTTHLACYLFAPPQASSSLNIHPLESSHTFYIAGFKQEPLLLCCNVKTSRNSEHLLSIHFLHLLPFPLSFVHPPWPNLCLTPCRRWSSTRWTVTPCLAIWYMTSSNSMWVWEGIVFSYGFYCGRSARSRCQVESTKRTLYAFY